MDKLLAIWKILNGKKVTIGALMLLGAQVLRMIGKPEWAEIIDKLVEILNTGGLTIVGVGVADKIRKKEWNTVA